MRADVPRGNIILSSSGAERPRGLVTPWGDTIYRVPTPPPSERRHPALMFASAQEYHEQMLYACIIHSRRYRARSLTASPHASDSTRQPVDVTANPQECRAFLNAWAADPDHYQRVAKANQRLKRATKELRLA